MWFVSVIGLRVKPSGCAIIFLSGQLNGNGQKGMRYRLTHPLSKSSGYATDWRRLEQGSRWIAICRMHAARNVAINCKTTDCSAKRIISRRAACRRRRHPPALWRRSQSTGRWSSRPAEFPFHSRLHLHTHTHQHTHATVTLQDYVTTHNTDIILRDLL